MVQWRLLLVRVIVKTAFQGESGRRTKVNIDTCIRLDYLWKNALLHYLINDHSNSFNLCKVAELRSCSERKIYRLIPTTSLKRSFRLHGGERQRLEMIVRKGKVLKMKCFVLLRSRCRRQSSFVM